MKRDMDLVRAILLALESTDEWGVPELQVNGYQPDQVTCHVMRMSEAGLLKMDPEAESPVEVDGTPHVRVERLTWQGHEFLDASRDPTRWEKAKGIVAKVGGATLGVLTQVLTQFMVNQVTQAMS